MEFQVYDLAILPIIVGLVAVIVPKEHKKAAAAPVAIFLGILAGVVYIAPGDLKQGILIGIALGLGATGGHSGTKNVKEYIDDKNK